MIKISSLYFFIQVFCLATSAQIKTQMLRIESLTNPVGLDIKQPRFSWQLVSSKRNTLQTAYEIIVEDNSKHKVWATGKIVSGQSIQVDYKGNALKSNQRYEWRVRIWDNYGNTSAWSNPAFWQTGFFDTAEWKAKWIQAGYSGDSVGQPCPLFRKQFDLNKKIKSATAYVTAHGLYEAKINGNRVGDAYLTPGWTSYNKRLQYQAYDVTALLKKGLNTIGATLGSGWYRGRLASGKNKNLYGRDISLLLQLEITFTDGTSTTITTDESWKSTRSNILTSEIYDGETIDASNEKNGWASPGYNDAAWDNVKVATFGYSNLTASCNEPVKKQESYHPVKVIITPKGEHVLDFGQNLVGWIQVKLHGKKGDSIRIYHAEVLDKAGNFYTANLRSAKATATYILNGDAEEIFEPHFTFFGFRYIKIEGSKTALQPTDFTAIVLHSNLQQTGHFTTSDTLINQLQHNIFWSQRGNFVDIPSDCPQRDERLGWVGDAQVFSRTAAFNMGVNNFFSKWMKDLAADQREDGAVPVVVPNILRRSNTFAASGWGDVSTIIPWDMYLVYADKKILETQYPSMKAWVEYIRNHSNNDLWDNGFHFGDWLFYRPDDDYDGTAAITNKFLIAQCFYAHSTQLLINTARVLDKPADVASYTALLQRIKKAFLDEYTTANGELVSATQTAYVLALNYDMLPEVLRARTAKRLALNIENYDFHLTTGFLGTPYICNVLSRFGYSNIAYKLLFQNTAPSWLYPVKMGATTIWERWDGQKPDSTFQTVGMNSFNHYAYGAVGDWMYRVVAGLDTYEDGPGYKHIKIQPHIGEGLTRVTADLQTNYGKLSNQWKIENGYLLMDVEIPVNTTATLYIPAKEWKQVTESNTPIDAVKDITVKGKKDDYIIVEMGSGNYYFRVAQ